MSSGFRGLEVGVSRRFINIVVHSTFIYESQHVNPFLCDYRDDRPGDLGLDSGGGHNLLQAVPFARHHGNYINVLCGGGARSKLQGI